MKRIVITAILVMLAAAGSVSAQPRGKGGLDVVLNSLNLTPQQMDKARALEASYQNEKEPLQSQLYTKRMELKLLWMQTKPEPEKVRRKQREIHDLQWQLRERRTNHRFAFRNILTQEQLYKYILLMQDHKRSKKKKGKWGR